MKKNIFNILKVNNLKNKRPQTNLIIGNFELIHTGHINLIKNLDKWDILTFKNIPRKQQNILVDDQNKIININKILKPQNIYVLNLKKNNFTANKFNEILLKKINPSQITVGQNFLYGKDFKDYKNLQKKFTTKIIKIHPKISSSQIKNLIVKGKFNEAQKKLKSEIILDGKVVKGKKIGRKLGFPTANFYLEKKFLSLPSGSYVCEVYINNIKKQGVAYISPKQLDKKQLIEVNVFNFSNDIYGKKIKITLKYFIRPTQKAQSTNHLKKMISSDVLISKKYFKKKN